MIKLKEIYDNLHLPKGQNIHSYSAKAIKGYENHRIGKFDFSFGKLRIEVKSSSTEIRTHHFSSSQLNPVNNSEIIIASILVNINAGGISLEEILGRINNRLDDLVKPYLTE